MEELYKKDLHDPDNHDDVITHLEPDILEYDVKQALGNTKTTKSRGGDRIPVELFQILKDDAVKVLHSICQRIWKTQQWPQDWKRSVFNPIPKKGNAKESSNYCTVALISRCCCCVASVVSDSVRPHRWQPTRLRHSWDSPGKNTNGLPFPSAMHGSEK